MKINSLNSDLTLSPKFGRAYTAREEEVWEQINTQAREALGLTRGDTFMICFDSCMPEKKGEDKGIGSSFSKEAQKLTDFAARKFGATGVQYSPQGRLSSVRSIKSGISPSPFSGTAFALGEHLIDLKQLTTSNFANILSEDEYKKVLLGSNSEKVDYTRILPEFVSMDSALDTAFANFQKLPENSPLKKQYNTFIKENKDWVEKEALYDALEVENDYKVWQDWDNEIDRDLFSGKFSESTVKERIKEIKEQNKETFERTLFTQFVLDKQQKETKGAYNKKGQKLVGDCLIGFSGREYWANREAFAPGQYLGCKSDKPNDPEDVQRCCWGIPALDNDKMGTVGNLGPAGKLLARKMEIYFQRYDAIRIDAAWQLIQPYIYEDDPKTGKRLPMQNQPKPLGEEVLKIIDATLKKARPDDYKTYPVNLELLGGPVNFKDPLLKNRTQIHHSIYQKPGWGSVEFYKNNGLGEDNFIFGLGTHDDLTLAQVSRDKIGEQAPVLAQNLKLDEGTLLRDKNEFCAAKFAEIFTTKNNFFTVFDAFGLDKRINTQNEKDDNWNARVPVNYEEVYHQNLVQRKGLNLADAYLKAMRAKNIHNPELTRKLEKARTVLLDSKDDIYSRKKADEKLGADYCAFG